MTVRAGGVQKCPPACPQRSDGGGSSESIGEAWIGGVEAEGVGRRKGRRKPCAATTVRDYKRTYWNFRSWRVRPHAGRRHRLKLTCALYALAVAAIAADALLFFVAAL